jgi:hypothetical protein
MRLMGTQCPSMERTDKRQRLIVLDRNATRTAASGCKTAPVWPLNWPRPAESSRPEQSVFSAMPATG